MNRTTGIVTALITSLLVLIAISIMQQIEASASCSDAFANLNRCQQLSSEIRELRKREAVATESNAAEQKGGLDATGEGLLRLTSQAGIPERQVLGIERLTPEKVSGTEYERDDVVLRLSDVTMEQIVRLMLLIRKDTGGASPTSLSLSTARRPATVEGERETWSCQLILTRLIYAATTATRG